MSKSTSNGTLLRALNSTPTVEAPADVELSLGSEPSFTHALEAQGGVHASTTEQLILEVADRVTNRQYQMVKQLFDEAKQHNHSTDYLIQNLCVLVATSFKEGINLALDTYGISQREP